MPVKCYCWVYVFVWCGNTDTDYHWPSRTRSRWSAWSIVYWRTRINGPQNEPLMLRYENSKKNAIWTTVLPANGCSKSVLHVFHFTDLQLLLDMMWKCLYWILMNVAASSTVELAATFIKIQYKQVENVCCFLKVHGYIKNVENASLLLAKLRLLVSSWN